MGEPTDWTLLARFLSGECSEEEKARVAAWMASDPENQRLIASMKTVWDTPEPQSETSDVSKLWREVADQAEIASETRAPLSVHKGAAGKKAKRFPLNVFPILRYAAVFLIAVSLTYLLAGGRFIFPWGEHVVELTTHVVENGGRDQIVLGDGTRIVLDAGSRLKYPGAFDGDSREVFLEGEAYFEVASNPDRPFVVHANHAVVRVLGTKFNVRAWQPDKRITVTVSEGKVSLGSKGRQEGVVIVKGQASTLAEGGRPSEPYAVEIEKFLGWMRNEAFFDGTPLKEILYQLERWHDVRFVLADASIAAEELTLHIQDQSLEDVLELLTTLTDLDYERTGKSVRFKPRD